MYRLYGVSSRQPHSRITKKASRQGSIIAHHLVHRTPLLYHTMILKYSLRTILSTAVTVLTVGMNLGILPMRFVDSFSRLEGSPIVSVRPVSSSRRFALSNVSESSEARSPSPNGKTPRRKAQIPTSSRSTAIFAMYESLRRQSTIAVRVMENDPTYKSLEGRDRAFARLLLTTAERRQGQIDKVIKGLAHITKTMKVRRS